MISEEILAWGGSLSGAAGLRSYFWQTSKRDTRHLECISIESASLKLKKT
jgi:hypothetical protein